MSFFSEIYALFTGRATGEAYMRSEPRATLTKASNSALMHINPGAVRADDAGNWTGCSVGSGNLVGTHRDLSACMASHILGRPITSEELGKYTEAQVSEIFIDEFNNLGLNQLTNQSVANLVMHIKLHFGNVRVVQLALNDLGENVSVDGSMGPETLEALKKETRKNPTATHNAIKNRLEQSYQNANPVYRTGFLNALDDFQPQTKNLWWVWAILILLLLIIITILYL